MTAGQHLAGLGGRAPVVPFLHQIAVAVDQLGIGPRKNDITVPALGRIILDGSHGDDVSLGLRGARAEACGAKSQSQGFQKLHSSLLNPLD